MLCFFLHHGYIPVQRCPRGVMVKSLDDRNLVSEFEYQSRYYAHFRIDIIGKVMTHPYPPSNVLKR